MRDDTTGPDDQMSGADETPDAPPIGVIRRVTDELLNGDSSWVSMFYSDSIRELRQALDVASRENAWEMVEYVFQMIASTSAEMALRSVLGLRLATRRHDQDGMAPSQFPPIKEEAERLQRIAIFLLDCATKYAKVRHVSSLVRRQGDPKIVNFDEAREKAERAKTEDAPEKKPEVKDA